MWSEDQLKWYDKQNKARPSHTAHNVSSDDLSKHVRKLNASRWTLEGNKLTCQTEMGPFVQFIPTNLVLDGVDEDNNPKFAEIKL